MEPRLGGLLLTLILLGWEHAVEAYPNGAPTSTCINNLPKHAGTQQQTPGSGGSPFRVSLSEPNYRPDDIITVTLTSKSGTQEFMGFQVKAQAQTGDTESLVGSFPKTDLPPEAKGSFWWPSGQSDATREPNCVTHADNRRRSTISLKWKAPSSNLGPIVFSAGFVEDFKTFWVQGNEAVLQSEQSFIPPTFASKVNTVVTPGLSLTVDCGRTKGCMLYPHGCTGNDCEFAVSYSPSVYGRPGEVDFEISAVTPGYVSLAFSDDVVMGNDQTVTCVERNGMSSVQYGYNPSFYNQRHPITGTTNLQVSRQGARLLCRFTRPVDSYAVKVAGPKVTSINFNLGNEWYLFLAHGDVYHLTDIPEKHLILPLISERKVNVLKNEVVGARSLHPTLRAHGSLGVVSWIGLVGTAIMIARFYRQTLGGKALGSAIWFQTHRALAITAIVISIIGVVIIFVFLKEWSEKATVHAILGLVALGLGLIQLLSGFLRPSPKGSTRPVFNWIHRLSGMVGFTCAAICVLLAFQIEVIGEPLRLRGTATVAAWLGFYLLWAIVLQIVHCAMSRNSDKVETVTKNGLSVQEDAPGRSHGTWRTVHLVWLGLGVLVTLVLTVLTLYWINVA